MKRNLILFFILIFLALPLLSKENLSQEHKNWLETVSPIITKTEKEIFFKLKTEEERNRFIQGFWKQRDPLPDTNQNEFYKEYMSRVQFADANFGHETSKRGSQTERAIFISFSVHLWKGNSIRRVPRYCPWSSGITKERLSSVSLPIST